MTSRSSGAYDVLDHVPSGCVVMAEDGRILFWNKAIETWTGRDRASLLGKNLYDAFPKLRAPRYDVRIRQTLDLGTPSVFSALLTPPFFETYAAGANRRFEQVTVTRTTPHNASRREILFTLTDVTEQYRRGERFREETRRATAEAEARRKGEAEVRVAMEHAEAATHAKSLFLAAMSHELRTPMNGVLGMCDLLLQSTLTPFQREHLEILHTSASSLLTVLNDILDFSKIEAQKLALEEIAYDPRRIVEESVFLVAEMAHGKDVECVGIVESDVPDEVVGDPVRFRQVLMNLLSNAIKFTNTGEIVVSLGVEADGDALRLKCSVRDSGPGMSEETRAKLFEPFVQATAATSRLHGGTGLGLSICRRLVRLMEGDISVESRVGAGSDFRFDVRVRPRPLDDLRPLSPHRVGIALTHSAAVLSLTAQLKSRGVRHVVVLSPEDLATRRLDKLSHVFVDAKTYGTLGESGIASASPSSPHFVLVTKVSARPKDAPGGFTGVLPIPCRRSAVDKVIGAAVAPAPTKSAEVPFVGLRVLVAEDNHTNQIVARGILTRLGCDVRVVDDGRAAIAAATAPFDVILMDLQMPEVDGIEAASTLRKCGYKGPIIALTASALTEDRDACLAAGMDDFLAKPLERRALVAALGKWSRPSKSAA